MDLQNLLKVLRNRWISVVVTAALMIVGSVVFTVAQTPRYEASTRLFVSTVAGTSMSDIYSGNRLSQERVLSYTQLIMGETLAQRTVERLNLDIDGADLRENVTAKSQPDTVLIDVSVLDESPVRARDIANALSDEFVVMVRELETPDRNATPDARVVVEQRAGVPTKPVVPRPKRNIAFGVVMGALLGMAVALVRDRLDSTVKDRDSLERLSGTSVVGVVPFDKTRRDHPGITFDMDNSAAAESFRKLRTNLKFLSVDDPPCLIVITSSVPNEGKSTTSINIALALAEADLEVLLVDGDMRRPSLDRYLKVVGSVGFSSVLSGGTSLEDAIQETKFSRLKVLAAGTTPPNPSELLGSLAAKKVLNELRSQFDYVIIDSPPLLAVTDGAILAAEADGAIILVRAGKTNREQLKHSLAVLRDVGATVLGSVLTMMPIRGGGSYSYNYYYHGKRYGNPSAGSSGSVSSATADAPQDR